MYLGKQHEVAINEQIISNITFFRTQILVFCLKQIASFHIWYILGGNASIPDYVSIKIENNDITKRDILEVKATEVDYSNKMAFMRV
jgi:hypothetical protein